MEFDGKSWLKRIRDINAQQRRDGAWVQANNNYSVGVYQRSNVMAAEIERIAVTAKPAFATLLFNASGASLSEDYWQDVIAVFRSNVEKLWSVSDQLSPQQSLRRLSDPNRSAAFDAYFEEFSILVTEWSKPVSTKMLQRIPYLSLDSEIFKHFKRSYPELSQTEVLKLARANPTNPGENANQFLRRVKVAADEDCGLTSWELRKLLLDSTAGDPIEIARERADLIAELHEAEPLLTTHTVRRLAIDSPKVARARIKRSRTTPVNLGKAQEPIATSATIAGTSLFGNVTQIMELDLGLSRSDARLIAITFPANCLNAANEIANKADELRKVNPSLNQRSSLKEAISYFQELTVTETSDKATAGKVASLNTSPHDVSL